MKAETSQHQYNRMIGTPVHRLVLTLALPAMASSCVMNNILRYEGKAAFAMTGLTSGAILNIFGDFLLIKICHLGIAGAGISTALRLQSITMAFMPFSLCGNMLFQSVGKGGQGSILASLRSGLLFIPVIVVLSSTIGILGIQLAQPIADIGATVATIPFVVHFFAKLPETE